MGEQRHPFKGGHAVCQGTADQFMPATGKFHELGLPKLTDKLATLALREEMFQFHTPTL